MINLCSNNHEEIVHESRWCPLCGALTDLGEEVQELKGELKRVKAELDQANEHVREFESKNG